MSLPPSVLTSILTPAVNGIVTPLQNTINPLLAFTGALPLVPTLAIDPAAVIAQAAAGAPISLQALNQSGTVVGPADRCDLRADSYGLNTQGGVAIGGNRITGLGTNGLDAAAGEGNSIAFGNSALTDPTAGGSIAFGTGAGVGAGAAGGLALGTGAQVTGANGVALGAGSAAGRGPLAGYAALGLAAPQVSAGEVSVGAPGAERQITNVAAGSAPTDAANVGQLAGVATQVGTIASTAVLYDTSARDRVTLAGPAGTTLANVAPGTVAAGSMDAVNGGQLSGLGGSLAAAIGGGTAYDPATNAVTTALTYGGTTFGSVQAAFDAVTGSVNGGAGNRFFRVQSARGEALVSADDAVAIGPDANVSAANSVALGSGAVAARGAGAGYMAVGLAAPQVSAGEVSIGAAGAERQLTNVAAGSAATDAVNVAQLSGVADRVAALGATSVQYDGADRATVTLGGAGGTTITNLRAGALTPTSTDAVNGAQLAATNSAVTTNSNAITSLANGATGPVRYSGPGSLTTPNGGVPTNDLTLVGAAAAPVALHNVAAGAIAAGSTDAVNGAQLQATNQAVGAAQTTAGTALALGQNSVQYDNARRTDITLGTPGAAGGAVALHNVAAGTTATDAVNLGQLGSGLGGAIAQSNAYTDQRLIAVNFDLRRMRRDSYAGTAGALAAAGLPQAYEAGRGMVAFAGGTYRGQSAFALGLSKALDDGRTVVKLSGTYDTRNRVGGAAGVGYQF